MYSGCSICTDGSLTGHEWFIEGIMTVTNNGQIVIQSLCNIHLMNLFNKCKLGSNCMFSDILMKLSGTSLKRSLRGKAASQCVSSYWRYIMETVKYFTAASMEHLYMRQNMYASHVHTFTLFTCCAFIFNHLKVYLRVFVSRVNPVTKNTTNKLILT